MDDVTWAAINDGSRTVQTQADAEPFQVSP